MTQEQTQMPLEPYRVAAFAGFFKKYMNISSIATATLTIPITSFGLIPTYKFQTKLLATYTPLFCFLMLGFIFYSRHQLARFMFPEQFEVLYPGDSNRVRMARRVWRTFIASLPIILICTSVCCVFQYHSLLAASLGRASGVMRTAEASVILEKANELEVEGTMPLMFYYLAIFMTAESAFILMAIKEFLQDLTGLSEMKLVKGQTGSNAA